MIVPAMFVQHGYDFSQCQSAMQSPRAHLQDRSTAPYIGRCIPIFKDLRTLALIA